MTFFIKVTPSHRRKLVKVRRTRPQLWKRCSGLVCALSRSHYHLGKRERGKDRQRENEEERLGAGTWICVLSPSPFSFPAYPPSSAGCSVFSSLWSGDWGIHLPESRHTSWWMPWNLPAERLSRAREFRGTHGELQNTKVSEMIQMFGNGYSFAKILFFFFMWRSGSIICQIGSMKGGQCVPLAARSKLVDLLFYCSGAFVCPSAKSKRHSCTVTSCFIMLLTLSCHIIRNTSTVLSLLLCDMELMLPEAPYQHKWLLRASISSLPV